MTPAARVTVLLALLASLTAPAHAQIYVDTDATGANDGTSWTDAYTDLQTAIDNADGSSELWIAAGVYTPDSEGDSFTIIGNKDGIELYGGFEGTESTRSARDPGANPTILSGDLNGDDTDPDGDGIIEDADPNQDGTPENLNGDENAHHVLFLDGRSGGTITTSTVIDGLVVSAGEADVGSNLQGGGLYCDGREIGNECSPTLRNVVFAGNAASAGGAIYNDGEQGTSSPTITNATFTGNSGGAIQNNGREGGTSSPTITTATFIDNSSSVEGGAIYNDGRRGTSSPTITNATFFGNWSGTVGGAIYSDAQGGGTASPQITNTILWNNNASFDGDEMVNTGATSTLSHTIIEGGVNGAGVAGDGSNIDGGGNLDQDPQFIDPSTPAGADGVFATRDDGVNVQDDSPALDAGDNNAVTPTVDITGADRLQDRNGDGTATVNIGAYEVVSSAPPVATTEAPSSVGTTSADFAGIVNPLGNQTAVTFEYRKTGASSFTRVTASESPLTGTSDQSVSASVSGLAPGIEYEVRVVASNSEGTDESSLKSFTTGTFEVAITGGGFGGLDRTFSATPGQANQPVGLFRLTPSGSGIRLTEGVVRTDAPDATGVDRVTLWISSDETFEAAEDTDLTSLDLDPNTVLPSSLPFRGFTAVLPDQARYLFVTVTLVDGASGEVTGFLENETALTLRGGQINKVNGNAGQSQFSSLPLSGETSALPVEMASFDGTTTEDGVRLRWKTASEQNNAGFRVLRKEDRERGSAGEWTEVGFVEGSGTTSEAQTYRFTDEDLPYAADSVSYRLRQVDTDGSASLTDAVTVGRGGPEQVQLLGTAPNPVRQRATVRFAIPEGADAAGATLRLYDVMGRQVRTVTASAEPGRHEQRLDVSGLASGVYVLRLRAGGQATTRKLTVVR
jgi:predicted outer membrane repeat protein